MPQTSQKCPHQNMLLSLGWPWLPCENNRSPGGGGGDGGNGGGQSIHHFHKNAVTSDSTWAHWFLLLAFANHQKRRWWDDWVWSDAAQFSSDSLVCLLRGAFTSNTKDGCACFSSFLEPCALRLRVVSLIRNHLRSLLSMAGGWSGTWVLGSLPVIPRRNHRKWAQPCTEQRLFRFTGHPTAQRLQADRRLLPARQMNTVQPMAFARGAFSSPHPAKKIGCKWMAESSRCILVKGMTFYRDGLELCHVLSHCERHLLHRG